MAAPRLVLDAPSAGPFRLWWGEDLTVLVEADAPPAWRRRADRRGHRVRAIGAFDPVAVGCAQVVAAYREPDGGDGCWWAASDPRSPGGRLGRWPTAGRRRAGSVCARCPEPGDPAAACAALAKQVPLAESLRLEGGRLVRAEVRVEMNPTAAAPWPRA